jgi:hypothetical protein
MLEVCSTETLVVFKQTSRRYVLEKKLFITAVRTSDCTILLLYVMISVITYFYMDLKKRFAVLHIFRSIDSCTDCGKY